MMVFDPFEVAAMKNVDCLNTVPWKGDVRCMVGEALLVTERPMLYLSVYVFTSFHECVVHDTICLLIF